MTEPGAGSSARAWKMAVAGGALAVAFVLLFGVAGSPFASTRTAGTSLASAVAPVMAHARKPLKCVTWVTDRYPADDAFVGVRVRTVRHARVRVVIHYRRAGYLNRARAGVRGRRTLWYFIGGAVPGFRVVLDVRVSRHGRKGLCSTWFVPHRGGGPSPSPSPTPTRSPSPTPTPPVPSPTPSRTHTPPPGGAWCTASVKTYPDSDQDEWYNDVKVRSNQPDASVTASGGDYSHSWWTDGSGSALVYLDGPPPGTEITVTVGGATCYTSN